MLNRVSYPTLAAAAVLALAAAGPALGQDRDRVRERDVTGEHTPPPDTDRDRLRTRDMLRGEEVSAEELAALEPALAVYAKTGGDPAEVRAIVREAKRTGCRGACLTEAVRAMNTTMSRGETAARARHMVENALREQARAKAPGATDGERGERLRARVEASAGEAERVRDRDREHERERARDREHVREPAGKGPVSR